MSKFNCIRIPEHVKPGIMSTNKRFKDLTGQVFGRLTVISYYGQHVNFKGINYWLCQCSREGNFVVVSKNNLISGTNSCGCLKKESIIKRSTKHGHCRRGVRRQPEYSAWSDMKTRCYNIRRDDYADYGARGIEVCERWLDPEHGFENFLEDMGPRPSNKHSVDRIDNDGDYAPENCYWATALQQAANTRKNRLITYDGRTQHLAAWAREFDINVATLFDRLESGWPVEIALTSRIIIKPKLTEEELRYRNKIRKIVSNAVASGTLIKPEWCEKCYELCIPQAHHYLGYSKEHALDVRWLCIKCHRSTAGPDDE